MDLHRWIVAGAGRHAPHRRSGSRRLIDYIQSKGKPDRRHGNLRAIRTHRQSKWVRRQRNPVALRMDCAAIGQHGADPGLR